jgi:hypothetical protein
VSAAAAAAAAAAMSSGSSARRSTVHKHSCQPAQRCHLMQQQEYMLRHCFTGQGMGRQMRHVLGI